MQMGTDFAAASMTDFAQHVRRGWINCNLISREVSRPHTQTVEERRKPPEFADVLDSHLVAAALPVVLLCVDGYDDEDAVRARGARLTHRSASLQPAWCGQVLHSSIPPNRIGLPGRAVPDPIMCLCKGQAVPLRHRAVATLDVVCVGGVASTPQVWR